MWWHLKSAEKFFAVKWCLSTPISEVLSVVPGAVLVRVRDDGALVITYDDEQKVIQSGEVVRVNRSTGAMRIFTEDEFTELHSLSV